MLLDPIDHRLLQRLRADGRISNADLASAVGLSPSACLRRVRRLEERGVIRGYAAILANEKFRGARLHIKRPDNNRDMTIREGETLDGQLVFMGAVAPTARKLKLVFNDGNQDDNIVAPGLVIDLPLQGG